MKHLGLYIAIAIVGLAIGGFWAWNDGAKPSVSMDDFEINVVQGQELYESSCAACHGANLEGQPNWQSPGEDGRLPAPPHDETGHTWHHPDSLLFDYTKLGGRELLAKQGMEFDSGMQGFGDQLNDEEIWNIIAFIKSTWPERIQKIQAERTAGDQG